MPDWGEILREIQKYQTRASRSLDLIRHKYLRALHKHTNRNIIAYYSGWLSKPGFGQAEINDEDKNGFMMAVHNMDRSLGLDLILHTPGGDIASTQSIVHYLQQMFNGNIRAVVPQIAMSAGTMMACSCREILMAKHSNLGPIDPQVRGVAAHEVKKEFKRALRECKKDPTRIAVWQQIIGQYRPTFLSQCEYAVKWSNQFVEEQLTKVMFAGEPGAKDKAKAITQALGDFARNKTHARHVPAEECKSIGLKVVDIEADDTLQDLILTVHHCYMHVFMNGPAYKIIENHKGAMLVKQQLIQPQSIFLPSLAQPTVSVPPPLQSPDVPSPSVSPPAPAPPSYPKVGRGKPQPGSSPNSHENGQKRAQKRKR